MARDSRTKNWVQEVVGFLDGRRSRVYTHNDFRDLLRFSGAELGIPQSTTVKRLLKVLLEETALWELNLVREEQPSLAGKTRYVWGDASPYSVGQSLAKGSYLSHASAVFLHALTDQVPKTIYVNKEQSPKPAARGMLNQPAIDRAFRRTPRMSKYVFLSPTVRYVLLSGKNTGRSEVSDVVLSENEIVETTKLERTLIDICVRPMYAGGVFEVLRAYRNAADRLSVNTLVAVLKKLAFVYPYHQAIGFLLERAGLNNRHLLKLEALGLKWNFYLDYQMRDPEYNDRWRLFYPQGF